MAKKGNNPNDVAEGFAADVKFKMYKSEGFYKFEAGDHFIGTLLSIRDVEIMDRRKKEEKIIRVYNFRAEDGTTIKLGSRAMLDRMFDDIMDENGGFAVENNRYSGKGYEYLQGRIIRLDRGEDIPTASGDDMGSYEVSVEE